MKKKKKTAKDASKLFEAIIKASVSDEPAKVKRAAKKALKKA